MPTHNIIILPKRHMIFTCLFPVKILHPIVFFPLYAQFSSASMSSPLLFFSLWVLLFSYPSTGPGSDILPPSISPSTHPSFHPSSNISQLPQHTHTVDLNSVSEVLAPFPKQCPDLNTCTRQKRAAEGGWVTLEAICLFLTFDSVYLCVYVWGGEGCFAVNSRPADFVHKQRTEIRGFNGTFHHPPWSIIV